MRAGGHEEMMTTSTTCYHGFGCVGLISVNTNPGKKAKSILVYYEKVLTLWMFWKGFGDSQVSTVYTLIVAGFKGNSKYLFLVKWKICSFLEKSKLCLVVGRESRVSVLLSLPGLVWSWRELNACKRREQLDWFLPLRDLWFLELLDFFFSSAFWWESIYSKNSF